MIEELLKEIKTRKNRLQKTKDIISNPSEIWIAQYKGQICELNYFIKLLEEKKEKRNV